MPEDNPETGPRQLLNYAVALLSQQCWCWGQDILRRKGNWLMEFGFERLVPPEKLRSHSSVYRIQLSNDRQLILRGFGVFLGKRDVGGVFLPRFEFLPRYTELSELDKPPWSTQHLPELEPLGEHNRLKCAALTRELLDWFADYETEVADRLGIAYREKTLRKWNDGNNPCVAASQFARAWRGLKVHLGPDLRGLS